MHVPTAFLANVTPKMLYIKSPVKAVKTTLGHTFISGKRLDQFEKDSKNIYLMQGYGG